MASEAIQEAVKQAMGDTPEPEVKEESQADDNSGNTKEEDVEEDEPEENPQLVRQTKALQILDLLEGENSLDYIKILAERAGLLKTGQTERQEVKSANKFHALVKEALGEEFEFLAPKLGTAIDKVAEAIREETKSQFQEIERQRVAAQIQSDIEAFTTANKVTEDEMKAMEEVGKQIKPAENVGPRQYMKTLLKIVRSEASEKAEKVKTIKRIEQNSKEQLASKGEVGDSFKPVKNPGKLSVRDAVAAAFRGEKFEE